MTAGMPQEDAVAIVAMAGRFPGAPSVEALWELVVEGRSALSSTTEAELLAAGVPGELLARPDYVAKTMPLADIGLFAARFFGYSQRQAEELDPQQRLFLEYAWIAAEQAGFNPETAAHRTGVFASVSANRYALGRLWRSLDKPGSSGYFQTSLDSDKDFLATRVAYKLDLRGPAITVQTACSSSLVAVHLACQSLLSYECDEALAGGVSLQIPHGTGYLFVEGGVAARDGVCRPFDDRATGTIQGSGVGVVALKRLEDALAEGDPVIAVIRGSAVNNDGARKAGFTAPSADGQVDVIRRAMAGIAPVSIGLIEAHGTGTLQGDAIELTALGEIYRRAGMAPRSCAIGSIKGHIGHLDVASGVTGLIKAALCLRHRTLPPAAPVGTPNKALGDASCPFYLAPASRPWASAGPRRAAVSSFGMGGTNAHLILEEALPQSAADSADVGEALLVLSGKGIEELNDAARQLAGYLRRSDAAPLQDVAYTLLLRRRRFAYRRSLVVSDAARAVALLEEGAGETVADERSRRAALLIGDPVAEAAPPVRGPADDGLYAGLVADCLAAWPDREEAERLDGWFLTGGGDIAGLNPVLHAIGQYCAGAWIAAHGVGVSAFLTLGRGIWIAAALSGRLPLSDALPLAAGRSDGAPPTENLAAVSGRQLPVFSQDPPSPDPLASHPWRGAQADLPVWIDLSAPGGDSALRMSAAGATPPEARLAPTSACARADWLDCVASLWKLGVPFHRKRSAPGPRLAPLPTYPWHRDLCWLAPEMPSGSQAEAPLPPPRLEMLTPGWVAAGPWPDAAAGEFPAADASERWILFGAEHPLAAAIAALLPKGAGLARVRAGARFEASAGNEYSLDPGRCDDVEALCRRLIEDGWRGGRAVNLWPLTGSHPEGILLRLAQSSARCGGLWPAMLSVTSGLFSAALEPEPAVAAALPGLAKVIAQETATPCGLVDFSPETLAETVGVMRAAAALLDEARGLRGATLAVYRGRSRFVPHHHEARWPDGGRRRAALKQGGRYLITGGFGALGLALVEYLASRYQARLGLLSRSPVVSGDVRSERLERIEAAGGKVLPLIADVADRSALEAAVRRGEELWGNWDGVFHLAVEGRGESIQKPIGSLNGADLEAQARPKLEGIRALDASFRTRPVDFKLAFSSIAVQLGGFGLGAYAAANSHLDHQARGWITVNWDGWALSAPPGTPYCIDTVAGLGAVETIIGNVAEGAVLVSAGDFRQRAETWLDFAGIAARAAPAPQPETEEESLAELLKRVWDHVLGLRSSNGDEKFFDVGGDSLIAMQLIEVIENEIGVNVPIERFLSGQITLNILEGYIVEYVKKLENLEIVEVRV